MIFLVKKQLLSYKIKNKKKLYYSSLRTLILTKRKSILHGWLIGSLVVVRQNLDKYCGKISTIQNIEGGLGYFLDGY